MKLPTYIEYIEQYIQFPDYESAQSPKFTEYHKTPFNNVVRFRTRQENIIANYLLAKENPSDTEQIKRLNTLRNTENVEMNEDELSTLYSFPFYMGQKSWDYVLSYKRGKIPEEVKRKIADAERGTKRNPEVGRKISETKRRRREERLAQMANSSSKGSNIDSGELSTKTEESIHSDI